MPTCHFNRAELSPLCCTALRRQPSPPIQDHLSAIHLQAGFELNFVGHQKISAVEDPGIHLSKGLCMTAVSRDLRDRYAGIAPAGRGQAPTFAAAQSAASAWSVEGASENEERFAVATPPSVRVSRQLANRNPMRIAFRSWRAHPFYACQFAEHQKFGCIGTGNQRSCLSSGIARSSAVGRPV